MKKLVLSLAALLGTVVMSAQEVKTAPVAQSITTHFVSVSTSIPTVSNAKAYPSIEFGHTTNDVSYSLVFGRGDFDKMFSGGDNIKDYYLEYKIVPSTTIGRMTFGAVIGAGTYLGHSAKSNNMRQPFFGEIGGVASYSIKKFSVGVSFTNWDGLNFLTPSITYNY